jgi:prepilin-type N-terminal cleavage/methylation domain-containing protein
MKLLNKKGFTLIELLVVIAIIGILSALILVSMTGAQNSAKDARIKAAMDQMRSVAEIYKMNVGGGTSYGTAVALGTCASAGFPTSTDGALLCTDINAQGGAAAAVTINTAGVSYCFSKALNTSPVTYNCVDSAGYVKTSATAICASGVYACPN